MTFSIKDGAGISLRPTGIGNIYGGIKGVGNVEEKKEDTR
jgi:hypothetical protein